MPPSSDPAVPTVTPVTISYSELQDKDKDLSVKIEEGFEPNGLGILSITQVPGYSSLRGNLPRLSPRLANLPEEVKKELEDPHSSWNLESLVLQDSPTTDESLIQRYPSYCGSNIWPIELPELEVGTFAPNPLDTWIYYIYIKICIDFLLFLFSVSLSFSSPFVNQLVCFLSTFVFFSLSSFIMEDGCEKITDDSCMFSP